MSTQRQHSGTRGATNLAVLLLAFLAGLAGGVVAARLAQPTPAAKEDAALGRALDALDATVRRLGEQVEALGRQPPRASEAPAEPLRSTSALPPELAPLVASLEQLAQAMRAQASGAARGGSSAGSAFPPLVVPIRPPLPEPREALAHGVAHDVLIRHLFWTYQQVLDAYGTPTYISIGDGHVTWQYELADGNMVGFRIFDGMVMDFWN